MVRERWILQFCHSYDDPFLDVARQYAALFRDTPFRVLTVYLTGSPEERVRIGSASDEVRFLGFSGQQVAGLKLAAIRSLRRLLAGRDIGLVIAHRSKPIYVACWATTLPVIGVHHAFGDYGRYSRRLLAWTFRKRLGLLAVSDAVRNDIRRCLAGWPEDRIATLYNRLDLEAASREILSCSAARQALGLPLDAQIIGNVGRLHPDKDQATLLSGFAAALPHLPIGTLLAIVGTGRLEGNLRAHAAALGVAEHVRFLGRVNQAFRYFRAFDLFVLTSDHEPFGMVLLEAMIAKVPVIATDCGGAPEIVSDPNSLFPLRDVEALARRLIDHFRRSTSYDDPDPRLQRLFSDEAARKHFFSLSMVRSALAL